MNLDAQMTGSREDPHSQARGARELPLLLHSMSAFREFFKVIFAAREITTVVEVGVESGQVSSVYAELGASMVHCVEPTPTDELRAALGENPKLKLVERPSPEALSELPVADLYVLDGDHNYATAHAELVWIMKNAPDAVVALHDVLWPWSRRDLYYQPSLLTAEDTHPATEDGVTVWHDDVTAAGFTGEGAFTVATRAGGERNGVLTAVEDALAEGGGDWLLEIVPAIFGMGVMVRKGAPGAAKILKALQPYTSSKLLATMENNRIALYTRVLQLQYEVETHRANTNRLVETMTAQRHEIERLRAELDRANSEVEARRNESQTLRHEVAQRSVPQPDDDQELGAALTQLGRAITARMHRIPR